MERAQGHQLLESRGQGLCLGALHVQGGDLAVLLSGSSLAPHSSWHTDGTQLVLTNMLIQHCQQLHFAVEICASGERAAPRSLVEIRGSDMRLLQFFAST
jgi:hypothetical protein